MQIAKHTLKLFEEVVKIDQGNQFRQNLQKVLPHISDAYRSDEDGLRSHLGASLIGRECGRQLWYSFRWFSNESFSGQMIRLFNRGHLEEGRFIALLINSGIKVYQQDLNGNQYRISEFGGHFGGSGDGILLGVPDIPDGEYCLSEFKTHNEKSFNSLKEKGVKIAKFEHYVQMQIYMFKMHLKYALYLAVNKNTDEIHGEIIKVDPYIAEQFIERAKKLIFWTIPKRISEKSTWYQCKFCEFHSICHKGSKPLVNCRTCAYSVPLEDGTWHCKQYNMTIEKSLQLTGCKDHVQIN